MDSLDSNSSLNIFFLKPTGNGNELYYRSAHGIHRSMDIVLHHVPNQPTRYPTEHVLVECQHEFGEGVVVQNRRGDEAPDIIKVCKLCGIKRVN